MADRDDAVSNIRVWPRYLPVNDKNICRQIPGHIRLGYGHRRIFSEVIRLHFVYEIEDSPLLLAR